MSYFAAILGYLSWLATVAIAYFASEFAVKKFDKKWKEKTEADEAAEG
ncbi:MAG TPA: hypothetical protein VJ946_12165 [Bacteroidales bacterium]|nr:hypothetical protein [Bacteroidales bacterium]